MLLSPKYLYRSMCLDSRGLIRDPPKKLRLGRTKLLILVKKKSNSTVEFWFQKVFHRLVLVFLLDPTWLVILSKC